MRWPPPSSSITSGSPCFSACSPARRILALPSLPLLPPYTVKSCETITAQRPSIRPVPVIAPSAGAGRDRPSSRTSPPISVKLPGSHRYAIRSRAVIAARRRCFSTASGRKSSCSARRAVSIARSRLLLSLSVTMTVMMAARPGSRNGTRLDLRGQPPGHCRRESESAKRGGSGTGWISTSFRTGSRREACTR